MSLKINFGFYGGVAHNNNLTGSCTLVTVRRGKQLTQFLVDAGMWQGNFQDSYRKNSDLRVDAEKVGSVILTHSHIDHIGRLPYLVRLGFRGNVFCTPPTKDFCGIMLEDTAKIIDSEAKFRKAKERNGKAKEKCERKYNRHDGKKKKQSADKDNGILYAMEDVEASLELIKNGGFEYREWFKIDNGIYAKFYPSGHVLGGAICVFRIHRNNSLKNPVYLGFSGDLGRKDGIILPPPEMVSEPLDHWFVESTYGGMQHPERDDEIKSLVSMIRLASEEKRKLLIPSFALERAQEIIYLLSSYMARGEIPRIPIYLDSPMARKITQVFSRNWKSPMFKDQNILDFNPFDIEANPFLKAVESDLDSVELTKSDGPYLVIAGSGMCEAGRIRNHLRENLSKSNVSICLIGYMASETLGRKLLEGYEIIRMNGKEFRVRAKVASFKSFSAHADGPYVVEYTKQLLENKSGKKANIYIVHGDELRAFSLKSGLLNELGEEWDDKITIPRLHENIITVT
jgi:metallo-beta-lactamase family protein